MAILDREILTDDIRELVERFMSTAVRLTWKEKCKQLLAWSYSPFISQTLELAVGTLCSVSYLRYLGAF